MPFLLNDFGGVHFSVKESGVAPPGRVASVFCAGVNVASPNPANTNAPKTPERAPKTGDKMSLSRSLASASDLR